MISSNNAVCTMQITDTAGSHQFPAMQRLSISKGDGREKRNVSSFYLNVLFPTGHAFIMVFSISSRQSLEELKPVLELINEVKGSLEGWPVLLVGNKCDEESGKRQVSTKTGEALEVSRYNNRK